MTLDNIPNSYVTPAHRVDSLSNRHHPEGVDHVPVPIGEAAYTTATTKETFRKRNNNKHALSQPNPDGYDSSDLDLFDSKSSKFNSRKESVKKASRKRDWLIVLALTVWALYIRLYKISQPSSVV